MADEQPTDKPAQPEPVAELTVHRFGHGDVELVELNSSDDTGDE